MILISVCLVIILYYSGLEFIKRKNVFFIYNQGFVDILIPLLFVFFFVVFRDYSVGNDTVAYVKNLFNVQSERYEIKGLNDRFELGYSLLVLISSKLFHSFTGLFFLYSCLNLLLAYLIIRDSDFIQLSLILFVLLCFTDYLNNSRQVIALEIMYFAFKAMGKQEFFRFSLFCLLASLFHQSAIVFIPFYFIQRIIDSRKGKLLMLILCLLIVFLFSFFIKVVFVFFPKYKYYLNTSLIDDKLHLGTLWILFFVGSQFFLILYIGYELANKDRKITCVYNNCLNLIFCGILVVILSLRATIIDRFTHYFIIYGIINVPFLISKVENRKKRVWLYICLFFIFFFCQVVIVLLKPEWVGIKNYKFIF